MKKIRVLINNKIFKAGSWYMFTNFFVKGLTFITIPIFTRILSTDDYGLVSLYNTWVVIFSIVIGLSLNESIRRAKYDYSDEYDQFASSITSLSLLVFFMFLGMSFIFKKPLQSTLGLSNLLFCMMIFQAYFSFVNELLITKLRFEYRYKTVSIISICSSLFGIILSIFLIIYLFDETPYLGKIFGNGLPVIILGLAFLYYLLKKGKTYINIGYWKYALILSTPLILHNVSNVANNQFDRILINYYLGEAQTGIYSFAYNIGTIVTVIAISLSQAWLPWFFDKFNKQNFQQIREKAKLYRDSFTFLYIILLMVSTELVKIMADSAYWSGLDIVPWIFMGHYFQFLYAFEVNVEFALKRTKLISLGTVLAAIINILLNVWLIPIYGYLAAAITTTISYFLLFIFHYLITSKIIKITVFGIRFHLTSIFYVLVSTVFFLIFKELVYFRLIGIMLTSIWFIYKVVKPYFMDNNVSI